MAYNYATFTSSHNANRYLASNADFSTVIEFTTSYNYSTNQTTITITDIGVSHTSGVLWGSCIFIGDVFINGTRVVHITNNHVCQTYIGSSSSTCWLDRIFEDDTLSNPRAPQPITVSGYSFTMSIDGSNDYCACRYLSKHSIGAKAQSKTITVQPPYRASSVSAANANIGASTTISISRDYSNMIHTLQYKIAGQSNFTTIVSNTSAISYVWTVPVDTYNYVGASNRSITITINCITYVNGTLIGSNTTTITVYTVESECKPTVSATHTFLNDQSSYTGNHTTAILNWSNVRIAVSATAKHGATISSYAIIHNGATSTNATTTYNKIQTGSWTYRATDSRGYVSEGSILLTTIAYFEPSITMTVQSPNPSTNEAKVSCKGNWFNGSFGSVSNSRTVQYRYKLDGGSYGSWTTLTSTATNNTYNAPATTIVLDYHNKYIFQARIVDTLNTKTTAEQVVITLPVFDWGEHDFHFNVPIILSSASYGSTLPQTGEEGQVFIKI